MPRRSIGPCLALALAIACATAPTPPQSGHSTAWGYVALAPKEGHTPAGGGGAYGDRRMADVELVDYSRPGFAVVYADGTAPAAETAELVLRRGTVRTRLEPARQAVGLGGTLRVHNDSGSAATLSVPEAGALRRIEADGVIELALDEAGALEVFLLGGSDKATVFVAPGPYSVVTEAGRFELRDLEPGPARLLAWHPRFPAAERRIDLVADRVQRVDLELGVDHLAEMPPDVP